MMYGIDIRRRSIIFRVGSNSSKKLPLDLEMRRPTADYERGIVSIFVNHFLHKIVIKSKNSIVNQIATRTTGENALRDEQNGFVVLEIVTWQSIFCNKMPVDCFIETAFRW
jgi:hypothetical protein